LSRAGPSLSSSCSRRAAGPRRRRLAASLRSPLRAERARFQRASRRATPARRGRERLCGSGGLAALAAAAEQGSQRVCGVNHLSSRRPSVFPCAAHGEVSPPSSTHPCGATSKATRARDPSRVRRCAMHAARGDSARCARSWARGPLFAPSRSSVRRLRPLPLLAAARARAAPHAGGGGRRGARSARGTAREVSGARATRPCGEPAPRAEPDAPSALLRHARRCALSVLLFFRLSELQRVPAGTPLSRHVSQWI
jgi:hypothetical protein